MIKNILKYILYILFLCASIVIFVILTELGNKYAFVNAISQVYLPVHILIIVPIITEKTFTKQKIPEKEK